LIELDEAVEKLWVAALQTEGDGLGVIGHKRGAQEGWAVGSET
jgi:hypothetical protein